jgi:isoleucyl-tRNA synthetase
LPNGTTHFENSEIFDVGPSGRLRLGGNRSDAWLVLHTLHAVSTLLFDRPAFENVIYLGHILDAKGGRNSLVYGLVCTALQPRRFPPKHVGEVVRQFILTVWNTYAFFVTYANVDG